MSKPCATKFADPLLFSLIRSYFRSYLPCQRKASPNTIRAYQKSLDQLLTFVKKRDGVPLASITFDSLDRETLLEFLDWLETKCGCSVSTRNHRLHCIRAFFAFAGEMSPLAVTYLDELRKIPNKHDTTKTVVGFMSEAAISAILQQPDVRNAKGVRDLTMMILLYDTGARVQELLNIRIADLRIGKCPSVILHGKGSKSRGVPLGEKTVKHLKRYMQIYHTGTPPSSTEYLFYVARNQRRCRMTEDNVRRIVTRYGAAARIRDTSIPARVHPHLFRHSRAMHLYQHGMDLMLVSQWLGHAQIETTLIYARADTEMKRKEIEKATKGLEPVPEKDNEMVMKVKNEQDLKRLYGLI